MENSKKLELTLCGMLPHKLKMQLCDDKREDFEEEYFYDAEKFKFGAEWELVGYNYTDDLNIPLGEGELKGMLLRNDMTYVNFKHYVLPKLHSLDKLITNILDDENDYFYKLNLELCDILEVIDCENFIKTMIDGGYYSKNINRTFEALEWLKENHFNIYDLPKEMYIEKSEAVELYNQQQ